MNALPAQQQRRINSDSTVPDDIITPSSFPLLTAAGEDPSRQLSGSQTPASGSAEVAIQEVSHSELEGSEGLTAVVLDDVVIEVATPSPAAPPPQKQYTVPYDRTSSLDEIVHSSVRLFGSGSSSGSTGSISSSRRLLAGSAPTHPLPDAVGEAAASGAHLHSQSGRQLAQASQEASAQSGLSDDTPQGGAADNPKDPTLDASQPLFRSGFEEPAKVKVLENSAVASDVEGAGAGSQESSLDPAAIVSGADVAQHEQMEAWMQIEQDGQMDLQGLMDLKSHVVSDPQGLTVSWVDGGDPCRYGFLICALHVAISRLSHHVPCTTSLALYGPPISPQAQSMLCKHSRKPLLCNWGSCAQLAF